MRRLFRSFERHGVEFLLSNLAALEGDLPDATRADLKWAARNSYRPEDRRRFLARLGRRVTEAQCRHRILAEVGRLQARDAAYWRRIVADLKRLHRRGALVPTGTPAAALFDE